MLCNLTKIVLTVVLDSQVLLEFVETEFISGFKLAVALRVLLNGIVGQVDVSIEVLEKELVGAGADVAVLVPVPLQLSILHYYGLSTSRLIAI